MKVFFDGVAPAQGSVGAAGYDLTAVESVTVYAGTRALVKTGLKVELPANVALMVVPRSGLALKHGVTVLNAPGIVDSDFRGEIGVILANHGDKPFTVETGDRIAQAVFVKVVHPQFVEAELTTTERGNQGYGSTGKK